jgi:hypothetical protein
MSGSLARGYLPNWFSATRLRKPPILLNYIS